MPKQPHSDEQAEIIRFMSTGQAFGNASPVSHIETHTAHVFLTKDTALKIKRAVRYDYLDQSTVERRQALLQREFDLNRPIAPMIYRDLLCLTRAKDGGLEVNGTGPAAEWVLRMHRFAPECELSSIAAKGQLTDQLAEKIAITVFKFHASSPPHRADGDALISDILAELGRVLRPFEVAVGEGIVEVLLACATAELNRLAPLLFARGQAGHVRRVHGDLHIRNLVVIDGEPVLFDALEFDEGLAICDVLYDLAFLVMDFCHRGLHRQANIVMNAYLLEAGSTEDVGLSALPLFIALRAAIRAMVLLQTDQATGHKDAQTDEARRYLHEALTVLQGGTAVLVAVGGISGSGKTVLARDLAAMIGSCPGAVHLRTDTERKWLSKATALSVAPQPSYTPADRSAVYERIFARTAKLLQAGRPVVVDATFLDEAQRTALQDLAMRSCVGFLGLWLSAPLSVLMKRVNTRAGDASQANARVVAVQYSAMTTPESTGSWVNLDSSSTPDATRAAAMAALKTRFGSTVSVR